MKVNNRAERRRHLHPQGEVARFTAIGKGGIVLWQKEIPLSITIPRHLTNRKASTKAKEINSEKAKAKA